MRPRFRLTGAGRAFVVHTASRLFAGFSSSRFAGAALVALALFATTRLAADAPPSARFSVLNEPDVPIEWGGVVELGITGALTGADPAAASAWKIALNGVPMGVARVFLGPSAGEPALTKGVSVYRLVLTRPDFTAAAANPAVSTTAPALKTPGDVIAATVRALAPERWSANQVAVQVFFAGNPLGVEVDGRNQLQFRLCSRLRVGAALVLVVLLVVAMVWAWVRTGAFRDGNAALPFEQRLFSLGRLQLAFWTVLVVGGYLFLYLTTGQFVGLFNTTAAYLLGISAATTVFAGAVGGTTAASTQTHVHWLTDILSDAQGVNLHRLQMAIWTLVFGLVFVSQLVTQFAFPVFDDIAYVLMGISSGTYVWLKGRET